jgi:hypothetical protein
MRRASRHGNAAIVALSAFARAVFATRCALAEGNGARRRTIATHGHNPSVGTVADDERFGCVAIAHI